MWQTKREGAIKLSSSRKGRVRRLEENKNPKLPSMNKKIFWRRKRSSGKNLIYGKKARKNSERGAREMLSTKKLNTCRSKIISGNYLYKSKYPRAPINKFTQWRMIKYLPVNSRPNFKNSALPTHNHTQLYILEHSFSQKKHTHHHIHVLKQRGGW